MRRIAIAAMAAIMLAAPAHAQAPAQRPPAQAPAQRPPAQAPRPAPQAAPAAPQVPTRVTAATLTAICGQDRSACLTYVLGAIDAFSAALTAAGRPQVFCVPRGTTNDQIAQAMVAFLRSRPQEGGSNAGLVILAGMTARYPCGY